MGTEFKFIFALDVHTHFLISYQSILYRRHRKMSNIRKLYSLVTVYNNNYNYTSYHTTFNWSCIIEIL